MAKLLITIFLLMCLQLSDQGEAWIDNLIGETDEPYQRTTR